MLRLRGRGRSRDTRYRPLRPLAGENYLAFARKHNSMYLFPPHFVHGHYFAPYSIDDIKRVADRFSVSREVIVRRLLELRKIDQSEYETYADLFRREIEEDREKRKIQRENGIKSSIPRNMSREAIDRTSPSVSKILYQGYVNDVYSKLDIARHLNVGQNHIDKFLREVSKWNR